jgi:hypothetical protein
MTRKRQLLLGLGAILILAAGCGSDDGGPAQPKDTTPPAAVNDLAPEAGAPGEVTLTWTAPSDVGPAGRASAYDLRYAGIAGIQTDWSLWTQASGEPTPKAPPQQETFTVTGLTADLAYAFRLASRDAAGNWSEKSNVALATAAAEVDATPPAAITDLRVWNFTATAMTLVWTAPGDDGLYGTAAAYELRYADFAINAGNWETATVAPAAAPTSAGQRQEWTVGGLQSATEYWFALKTADEVPLWSGISNVVTGRTSGAQTLYVKADGTGDVPTIQAAIDAIRLGADVDEILVAPGTYSWSNQGSGGNYSMILFERELNNFILRSESGPEATILDAEGQSRVIRFIGNTVHYYRGIIIDGFTLTGGDATQSPQGQDVGGGFEAHLASPVIRNCIITGNRANDGGGIGLAGQCAPLFDHCLITGNTAGRLGGGMFFVNSDSIPQFIDCLIADNSAGTAGGGLFSWNFTIALQNCTLAGNSAPSGGGLRLESTSVLTVDRCIVAHSLRGGAYQIVSPAVMTIGCCDTYGNIGGNGLPLGATDLGGNFTLDPKFCGGTGSQAFMLRSNSPCAAGNHPSGIACGLIGAYPVGCQP